MQAVQSTPSQPTHKRLEDLEEAFEDSKAERNSMSHQMEGFVQGLPSMIRQTQQRLSALESFQATVAAHQHQVSTPEGLDCVEQACAAESSHR